METTLPLYFWLLITQDTTRGQAKAEAQRAPEGAVTLLTPESDDRPPPVKPHGNDIVPDQDAQAPGIFLSMTFTSVVDAQKWARSADGESWRALGGLPYLLRIGGDPQTDGAARAASEASPT